MRITSTPGTLFDSHLNVKTASRSHIRTISMSLSEDQMRAYESIRYRKRTVEAPEKLRWRQYKMRCYSLGCVARFPVYSTFRRRICDAFAWDILLYSYGRRGWLNPGGNGRYPTFHRGNCSAVITDCSGSDPLAWISLSLFFLRNQKSVIKAPQRLLLVQNL